VLETPSGHSDLTKLGLCPGHRSRVFLALLGLFCACGGTKPLTALRCPSGQHDGGDGNCVREGTCSDGYYDDGTGTCRPPDPQSGEADIYLPAVASRQLDMVFMIDNSPSMSPKVTKMNAQFPRLIAALQDPGDSTLPDLRIAFIDSDLGTAGAYASGACGPRTLPDGTQSIFGDLGRFQMRKEPSPCTVADGALFLEHASGLPVSYTGDINTVFACLTGNMGDSGCGMEHQLQAFEFALAAKGLGNEQQQKAFLRNDAILALIFITDEDDCSAATNDGLFGDIPDLRSESAMRSRTAEQEWATNARSTPTPPFPRTAIHSGA
jgi:hypothetical protein